MIQLCWMPTWSCQNYSKSGDGHNPHCPYCPLGTSDGKLTFHGQAGSVNGTVDAGQMAAFLVRHRDLFGSQLTISGGEPLASPSLATVLQTIVPHGYTWGVTSNSTLLKPLAQLSAALGGFASCRAWTASYHPFAGYDDQFEQAIAFLRSNGARWVYCNVVASPETINFLEGNATWLMSLPLDRVHFLVDMYRGADVERVAALAAKYPGRCLAVGSGQTVTGTNCHTLNKFLVVSPTGIIYQCVRKCYAEIDPIGTISDALLLDDRRAEWCGLDCPHTCDQIKHAP